MLKMLFPNGVKKAFTLSYDDGLFDDIRLMELMELKGVKGTFNVSSGIYRPDEEEVGGRWPRLTFAEAVENYKKFGVEIAVHGLVHRDFTKISEPELYLEISQDRAQLEEQYGMVVRGAAYPYGSWDERAVHALKHCGIKYCRTVGSDYNFTLPKGDNWLRLNSTCHHNSPNLMELAEKFVTADFKECKMFYVWGHTAEFRNDNNWHVIEKLLDYVAGKEDIWYATNIEICEYTLAYDMLEWSVAPNSRMVYNPTAKEIWLEMWGGSAISVKPGETLKF